MLITGREESQVNHVNSRAHYLRDYAMYAVIFGVFGFSWFGWAQESPPESWRIFLGIASSVSFIVACIGGFIAVKHWGAASALNADKKSYIRFRNIVIPEILFCFVGAMLLMALNMTEYIAPYIALIVGIHFIPLVGLFKDKSILLLALLVILSSITSVLIANQAGLTSTTIATILTGSWLFIFALRGLYKVYLHRQELK